MTQTRVIWALVGIIIGMFMTVPFLFLQDVVLAGIIVGGIAYVIGYFVTKKQAEKQTQSPPTPF